MAVTLRLGTRGSRLAVAQSQLTAAELLARNPELRIELVQLDTRGDHDLQTPLTEVRDPQFFSAELDAALLEGAVDFCVHSWKDIVGQRPAGLVHAATPRRARPHDVVLFRHDILERLREGARVTIGTCSQRRTINVGDFLRRALPRLPGGPAEPRLEFRPLRGAVDARVGRILPTAGEEQLDGVVIALAGLQRLHADADGRAAIAQALATARWMVLPLSACPTAAAQGALALECRRDDTRTRELLASVHDQETQHLVQLELEHSTDSSGSIPTLGATAVPVAELNYTLWLRGRKRRSDSTVAEVRSGADRQRANTAAKVWQATRSAAGPLPTAARALESHAVFVAHADAASNVKLNTQQRVWTSGVTGWLALAARGIWVEGCGDGLGFANLRPLLAEPVLGLPALSEWTALSHDAAVPGWAGSGVGQVIATYALVSGPPSPTELAAVASSTHFYWASARQYQRLRGAVPPHAQHACGCGKTLHALRAAGLHNVQPFASRQEWQAWLS